MYKLICSDILSMNRQLQILDASFNSTNSIILFGAGRNCGTFINNLKKDVSVEAFIDNDLTKQGTEILGIRVYSFKEVKRFSKRFKIIINSETYYHEMAAQLRELGLVENVDFTSILKFQAFWYWNNKQKIILFQTTSYITSKCTLNCLYCESLIPYYSLKYNVNFLSLKNDYDLYFSIVDKVRIFHLFGGEPFLHNQLLSILAYLMENFSYKIDRLRITTNGMIVPSHEILKYLSEKQIYVVVSDYNIDPGYKKIQKFVVSLLMRYNIPFDIDTGYIRKDFCIPRKKRKPIKGINTVKYMRSCSSQFRCIGDEGFYYCGTAYNAEKIGYFKHSDKEFIDMNKIINNIDKRRFLEFYLGEFGNSNSLSLCKDCAGYSKYNTRIVNPIIQC